MAGVPPKLGEAYTLYFSVVSQANFNVFQANPTIAAGDFQYSRDGGATFNNPATMPSIVAGKNKVIQAFLSATEMTPTVGDSILFFGSDQAGAEWQDISFVLTVVANTLDDVTSISFPAGAIEFTYTLTNDVTGLPIIGADIWISTDAGSANVVWRGTTDSFGVARDIANEKPWLDAGLYAFHRQAVGFSFTDPDWETVS